MTGMTKRVPEFADVELAARLRLALGRLSRRLRQHGVQGLTASQVSTLASVETLGAVRLGDLAAYEGVTAPTQSRLVATLEVQGLLTRTADPDDKRATRLDITAEGRRRLEQLRNERSAFLVERLGLLSLAQRQHLIAALDALEALAEADPPP